MTNESEHFQQAEAWLKDAECEFAEHGVTTRAQFCAQLAGVHAQLAEAADVDREASAAVRLSSAVKDGTDALDVSVRGVR